MSSKAKSISWGSPFNILLPCAGRSRWQTCCLWSWSHRRSCPRWDPQGTVSSYPATSAYTASRSRSDPPIPPIRHVNNRASRGVTVHQPCLQTTLQWCYTENSKHMYSIFPKKGTARQQSRFLHSCFCVRFIYFPEAEYADWSWENINRSQTHEYGNWDWGRAVPYLGIHKSKFLCSRVFRNRIWHYTYRCRLGSGEPKNMRIPIRIRAFPSHKLFALFFFSTVRRIFFCFKHVLQNYKHYWNARGSGSV